MAFIKIKMDDCDCAICEPGRYARRRGSLRERLRRWLNRWR